jgi:hypothetical protein
MIDSCGRIAEAVMTFYNKTPLTAFLQIDGFEDANDAGAKVAPALNFFDDLEDSKLKFSREHSKDKETALEEAKVLLGRSTKRQAPDHQASYQKAAKDLAEKTLALDKDFLAESMTKMSALFFYPEISDAALILHSTKSGNKNRVRDSSQKNLEAAIAKYIHILTSIYPELPGKLFSPCDEVGGGGNKEEVALAFVTKEFTKHIITSPYQTKSGVDCTKGWPTFDSQFRIRDISSNAVALVCDYKKSQALHSYQNTRGHRSAASSTDMEETKRGIVEPVVSFIAENFGLEEKRLEALVKQLNELDLTDKSDDEFKREVLTEIKKCGKKNRVEKEAITALEQTLFQEKDLKGLGK